MAFESKIVQVYPSDAAERRVIEAYEAGEWELVSSERKQETHGDKISTFTRLQFRRDKDIPNYEEIRKASDIVEDLSQKSSGKASRRGVLIPLCLFGAIIFIFLAQSFSPFLYAGVPVMGILTIVQIIKVNKAHNEFAKGYEEKLNSLRELVRKSKNQ